MQQKRCYATTKHDFTRQDMYAGKRMSWKVVESRCNKNCVMQRLSTTEHDIILKAAAFYLIIFDLGCYLVFFL